MYRSFGLNDGLEGDKYLTQANYLVKGEFHKAFAYQYLYSGYIIYLSFFKILHLSNYFIFISNYILSMCSYLLFYKLLKKKTEDAHAKVWITLVLLSPIIQYWNLSLFSETFFISMNLLFFSILFSNRFKFKNSLLIVLGIFLVFSRPNGIISLGLFLSMYIVFKQKMSIKKTTTIFCAFSIILFLAYYYFIPLHYKGYCVDITKGSIYCGFPQFQNPITPVKDYTLNECYVFLYNQYGLWFLTKLCIQKMGSFFILSRPYYSPFHNTINSFHSIFYIFSFIGIFKTTHENKFKKWLSILSIWIVLINALLIGIFFNEWSERYTVVVFPFIFILATNGIIFCYNSIKSKIAV